MSAKYIRELEGEVAHWKHEAEKQRQRALTAESKLNRLREQLKAALRRLDEALREAGGTPF